MRMSEPVSMALKSNDNSSDEKKSRDQTLPLSAFSSRSVFGMPWRARLCSRMMAASADVFSWKKGQARRESYERLTSLYLQMCK